MPKHNFILETLLIASAVFAFLFLANTGEGAEINMQAIMMLESSGNPLAHNKREDGRGLFQINKICLEDWNNYHATKRYTMQDLWNPVVNREIAKWYLTKRIPQMLRYYKRDVNVENILKSYNAGILYVVKNKPVPKSTREYIKKYKRSQ